MLKGITIEMDCLKERAMFYLAAAVSDFFIPKQRMVALLIGRAQDPIIGRWFIINFGPSTKDY